MINYIVNYKGELVRCMVDKSGNAELDKQVLILF